MGRTVGSRPKSVSLVALWLTKREAVVADWVSVYGIVWQPCTLGEWLTGTRKRGNLGIGAAWRACKTIMLDRQHSRMWCALTDSHYLPSGAEEVYWSEAAATNRIRKGKTWRPWLDPHGDPFREVLVKDAHATDREALKKQFHIED